MKQAELGAPVAELYDSMDPSEARELKQLRDENGNVGGFSLIAGRRHILSASGRLYGMAIVRTMAPVEASRS